MKYRLVNGEKVRLVRCLKGSSTVIAAGDLVAMSSGLIIKAVGASAAIGWCPAGGANGDTVVEVSVGNDFTLETTAESAFAVTYKGGEYDINNDGTQTIDWDASSTDVLKIDISENAGVVGSAENVRVKINKPLF
jgi:hypothetical protein